MPTAVMEVAPARPRARHAFKALSAHFESLADICCQIHGSGEAQAARIADSIDVLGNDDYITPTERHDEIHRRLQMSWAIESQLRMRGRLDPQLRAHVLHGVAPEAYYAVYHAARAYLTAATARVPDDKHRQTLDTLARHAVEGRFPAPFDTLVRGGLTRKRFTYVSTAPSTILEGVLGTTREGLLKERSSRWRSRNPGKAVTRAVRESIVADAQPTTVFDVFLRHRERSNYRDATAFLDAEVNPEEAEVFFDGFRTATAATVTTLNLLTARHTGNGVLLAASESFLRDGGARVHDAVSHRVAVLNARRSS